LLTVATIIGVIAWWPVSTPPLADSEWRRLEREVAGASAAMREAVGNTSGASYYLQPGDDVWQRELEALDREIAAMETEDSSFSP
jgi:hypothetical protein